MLKDDQNNSNMIKDPEWTTGDEPITGAQQSYLKTDKGQLESKEKRGDAPIW